jgi:hypothetical protein
MAGAGNEPVLASKAQKAWIKPHQVALVLGNRRSQVVVPELACDAGHRLKGVHVATHESFKALAVSKLQVHLAAVALDETEGVKLPRGPVVNQCAEVSPVDVEALAGGRLHPYVSTTRRRTLPDRAQVIFDNRDTAGIAERLQALHDHGCICGGILLQQFRNGRFERIEYAGALAVRFRRRRHIEIPGNRAPSDMQMAGDLAYRPLLDPVQAVHSADLIRRKHRQISLYGRTRRETRTLFFSRTGPGFGVTGNRLKNQELTGSQVVLFKIPRCRPH